MPSRTFPSSTRTSRFIEAPAETIYRAFLAPDALVSWLVPGKMTGKIHAFEPGIEGGYQMSLYYLASGDGHPGKSAAHEDRYTSRFVELMPPSRIVAAITFEATDPGFQSEMLMTVTLDEQEGGTLVTIQFDNIPPGIRPEDNDAGTRSSLEKLARYVEAELEDRIMPLPPAAHALRSARARRHWDRSHRQLSR